MKLKVVTVKTSFASCASKESSGAGSGVAGPKRTHAVTQPSAFPWNFYSTCHGKIENVREAGRTRGCDVRAISSWPAVAVPAVAQDRAWPTKRRVFKGRTIGNLATINPPLDLSTHQQTQTDRATFQPTRSSSLRLARSRPRAEDRRRSSISLEDSLDLRELFNRLAVFLLWIHCSVSPLSSVSSDFLSTHLSNSRCNLRLFFYVGSTDSGLIYTARVEYCRSSKLDFLLSKLIDRTVRRPKSLTLLFKSVGNFVPKHLIHNFHLGFYQFSSFLISWSQSIWQTSGSTGDNDSHVW